MEESLDVPPDCSALLNWSLGAWSPHSAPARRAKELLGLLQRVVPAPRPREQQHSTTFKPTLGYGETQPRETPDLAVLTLGCSVGCSCEQAGAGYLVSADSAGRSDQFLWARV